MKIVFTGGRDYLKINALTRVLEVLRPTEIFVGDCPTGLDATVAKLWLMNKELKEHATLRVFKADWVRHGKAAGPMRNFEMLQAAGGNSLVIAFPGGRGTENCVKSALDLGMTVLRIQEKS